MEPYTKSVRFSRDIYVRHIYEIELYLPVLYCDNSSRNILISKATFVPNEIATSSEKMDVDWRTMTSVIVNTIAAIKAVLLLLLVTGRAPSPCKTSRVFHQITLLGSVWLEGNATRDQMQASHRLNTLKHLFFKGVFEFICDSSFQVVLTTIL